MRAIAPLIDPHVDVLPVVLAELDHLVTGRFGRHVAGTLLDEIARQAGSGRFVITVTARDNYTNAILTLDRRDFRTIRPLTEDRAFRVLPHDV